MFYSRHCHIFSGGAQPCSDCVSAAEYSKLASGRPTPAVKLTERLNGARPPLRGGFDDRDSIAAQHLACRRILWRIQFRRVCRRPTGIAASGSSGTCRVICTGG
jgi:hypothetical protein